MLNVYGASHDEGKEAFLVELAAMCSKNKDPYVIGGDFNIMRFSSDKNKPFQPNKYSAMFNSVIQLYELREIYISGGSLHGPITRSILLLRNWIGC
jgi:exonuclease III